MELQGWFDFGCGCLLGSGKGGLTGPAWHSQGGVLVTYGQLEGRVVLSPVAIGILPSPLPRPMWALRCLMWGRVRAARPKQALTAPSLAAL